MGNEKFEIGKKYEEVHLFKQKLDSIEILDRTETTALVLTKDDAISYEKIEKNMNGEYILVDAQKYLACKPLA